ncbi:hypothetical protein [Roseobacter sp. A03A-229]
MTEAELLNRVSIAATDALALGFPLTAMRLEMILEERCLAGLPGFDLVGHVYDQDEYLSLPDSSNE